MYTTWRKRLTHRLLYRAVAHFYRAQADSLLLLELTIVYKDPPAGSGGDEHLRIEGRQSIPEVANEQ